jgi:hypothetical protein
VDFVSKERLNGFQSQNLGHQARGYCLPKLCKTPRLIKTMFGPSEDCMRESEKIKEKESVANMDLIHQSLGTPVCMAESLFKRGNNKGETSLTHSNGICNEPSWQSVVEIDAMDHSFNYWFRPLDRDMPQVSPVYTPNSPYGGSIYTGRNLMKQWYALFAESAREVEDMNQVGQGMRLSGAQNAEMQMPDAWVGDNADTNGREMIRKESELRMMGVQGEAAQRLVETVVGTEMTVAGLKIAEAEKFENRMFAGNNNDSLARLDGKD